MHTKSGVLFYVHTALDRQLSLTDYSIFALLIFRSLDYIRFLKCTITALGYLNQYLSLFLKPV